MGVIIAPSSHQNILSDICPAILTIQKEESLEYLSNVLDVINVVRVPLFVD